MSQNVNTASIMKVTGLRTPVPHDTFQKSLVTVFLILDQKVVCEYQSGQGSCSFFYFFLRFVRCGSFYKSLLNMRSIASFCFGFLAVRR